jgi:hypothetical protein
MSDNITSSRSETGEMTDVTDNSLITDFTQVVSCAVGRDRAERQRQKIRRELVQQYFADEQQAPADLLSRVKNLLSIG